MTPRTSTAVLVSVLTCSLILSMPSSWADPATVRVSVDGHGSDADGDAYYPVISADGRFVAFSSNAPDIVANDDNGMYDIFVRDILARTTVRVSVDKDGRDADGDSYVPTISANGRFVAFRTVAADLVDGDTNSLADIFVRDTLLGTTTRVSVDTDGGDPDGASVFPSISADGRYVAFRSEASDLVLGDANDEPDIFVRDLVAGTTVRASVDTLGGDPDGDSYYPSMSADGRMVSFRSEATDLVADDTNGLNDVFVRDLVAATTVRASVDTNGGNPNGDSLYATMSGDGRYVVFSSGASDLVPGDSNGVFDVFVRDLQLGTTVRASVDSEGGDADAQSSKQGLPTMSSDGRYVAFESDASDIVPGDTNLVLDIFIRDMVAGTTVRATVDPRGGNSKGASFSPVISADGQWVTFFSYSFNLIQGDTNNHSDAFVRRLS
jgi:Tol biopolymer transport system component